MEEPHLVADPSKRHDDSSTDRPEPAPVDDDSNDGRDKLALVVIIALMFVAVLAATNITGAVLATVLIPIVTALSKR